MGIWFSWSNVFFSPWSSRFPECRTQSCLPPAGRKWWFLAGLHCSLVQFHKTTCSERTQQSKNSDGCSGGSYNLPLHNNMVAGRRGLKSELYFTLTGINPTAPISLGVPHCAGYTPGGDVPCLSWRCAFLSCYMVICKTHSTGEHTGNLPAPSRRRGRGLVHGFCHSDVTISSKEKHEASWSRNQITLKESPHWWHRGSSLISSWSKNSKKKKPINTALIERPQNS